MATRILLSRVCAFLVARHDRLRTYRKNQSDHENKWSVVYNADIAEQQALALRLNVTGSQFFAMDAEAIVRRLGGTLKCVHLRDLHLASQHLVCDMDMHDHWID